MMCNPKPKSSKFVICGNLLSRLAHCCAISLCHLGCEIDERYQNPMSTSKDNLVGQFTMSLQAAMANVDEHYTVVGVAELWEESLEVAALKWESRNYISF